VPVFRTPSAGALRLGDEAAVSEAVHDGVMLRHYAFAGHWFKVNVTTSLSGQLRHRHADGARGGQHVRRRPVHRHPGPHNHVRRHSALGMRSPVDYERSLAGRDAA